MKEIYRSRYHTVLNSKTLLHCNKKSFYHNLCAESLVPHHWCASVHCKIKNHVEIVTMHMYNSRKFCKFSCGLSNIHTFCTCYFKYNDNCIGDYIKMNGSIWKACNTRNNYNCSTCICFHIKQKITKELSMDIACIFEIICMIPYIISLVYSSY